MLYHYKGDFLDHWNKEAVMAKEIFKQSTKESSPVSQIGRTLSSKASDLRQPVRKPGISKQNDPIGTGKVTVNALNVREGAGQNYRRIGGLTKGKVIQVYEEKDGWLRIAYGSGYGWVMKAYTDYKTPEPVVEPEQPKPTEPEQPTQPETPTFTPFQVKVTADVGLNMRNVPGNGTTPASGSQVYFTIPYGTILTVTAEQNGWYKVSYNGKEGWVCANWTVDYDPSAQPPAPTVNPDGVFVDVELKPQQTNYTCGSASGAMVSTTYSGKNVTESEIWNYANSGGQGTYVYAITNAINYYIQKNGKGKDYKYAQTSSDKAFFEGVQASLGKNAPVQLQLKPSLLAAFGYKSDGHYVVASGAFVKDGVNMLRITDPFSAGWKSGAPKGQVFEAKASDIRYCIRNHSNYVMLHKDCSV